MSAAPAMRVCIVARAYPPRRVHGGIGTYMRNLARGLTAKGHTVHVVTQTEPGQREAIRRDGEIVVHTVHPMAVTLRGLWRLERWLPSTIARLRYAARVNQTLQELIREQGIDVVVSAQYPAETWWFAMFGKTAPLVVCLVSVSFAIRRMRARRHRLDNHLADWTERLLIAKADALHAVSRHVVRGIAKYCGNVRHRDIPVIPSPVDTQLFRPNGHSGRHPSGAPHILYVGSLAKYKGVEVLAQAIQRVHQRHPKVRFTFIGREIPSGQSAVPMRTRLMALLGPSADRVAFLDHQPQEALVRSYQQSTVCVFPSLEEGLANTCLEAMACGKPVIVTSGTGLVEAVTNRLNGLVVRPGSVEELTTGILELLEDQELRTRLGQAARQTIERRFASERIAAQWVDLLREVHGRNGSAPHGG